MTPPSWLSYVGAGLALLGLLWTGATRWQATMDADAKRDEHIRVLQQIIVSEFPAYSPMIYVKGAD